MGTRELWYQDPLVWPGLMAMIRLKEYGNVRLGKSMEIGMFKKAVC